MNIFKKLTALFAALLVFAGISFAEKTPVENLYQYTLDNGLTLFVNENHTVPLVYIEIAVRAGAVTQTPETAGLFHLYEHMMFKGNELYPDASSVQKAITDLGVSSWNGTTSTDHVNYFFTIPSEELESGLAFWNAAVRTPLMNPEEFETEKGVVLSEIVGDASEPAQIFYDYVNGKTFPDAPFRADAGGSIPVVQNATVAQMRDIQARYYIPCNAALFVGGDVSPDEVYTLVQQIYGDWSNNGNSRPAPAPQQNTDPFLETEYCVMPYDQLPPFYAQVQLSWRGPDTDFDIQDTYAADVISNFIGDPDGLFLQTLVGDEELGIPDYDYAWGGYTTSRASGTFDFGGVMLSPEQDLPARVNKMVSDIQDDILPGIAATSSYYTKANMKKLAQSLKDSDTRAAETAEGMLSNLRFWWTCSSPEYYYSYNDKMAAVKQNDVKNFVSKYFEGKKPIVCVLINPDVYEQTKDEFAAAGYKEIGAEDTTWWKMDKFQPDQSKIAQETEVPSQSAPIYRPTGKKSAASTTVSEIKTFTLSNGIPVYVKADKTAKIDTVSIGIKGGVEHLTPETSGLESAMFNMMSKSSKSYSMYDRQSMSYNYGIDVSFMSKMSGSALSVTSLHSYFDKALPVLTDSFINPDYDEEVYENLMNDYMSAVQETLTDPASLLSYTISKDVYAGHPYETQSGVTPDSVNNITIEAMQQLHDQIINPSEIFVVAVGNIDGKKLVKTLNKTIGKIKSNGNAAYVAAEVPLLTIENAAPVVMSNDAVANSGYVARVFASAPNYSEEYVASSIAADIYSDILYNVVRERYAACYTPYSYTIGSRAPYGIEFLYNLSDYANFSKYMEEARNYMSEDQVIIAADENGYSFSTVEECLESYKNKYITGSYDSLSTTVSNCQNLTYNVMQFNDINHDAAVLATLDSLTAKQVLDVFNKYWVNGASRWYVIVGPEDTSKLTGDFAQ